jgi:hypothetical protein
MRRPREHSHPCRSCGAKVPCSGDLIQNYDGFPEVICSEYHERYRRPDCEACEAAAPAEEDE